MENNEHQTDGLEMERYATVETWALELGIPAVAIQRMIEEAKGVTGKFLNNRIGARLFFAESHVREKCAGILELPHADENGMLEYKGQQYGSLNGWCLATGLAHKVMANRLDRSLAIDGFDNHGRMMRGVYFPETHVAKQCADLLADVPSCNDEGMFVLGEETYASGLTWSRRLGISRRTLLERLDARLAISARDSGGKIQINTYFPESTVKAVVAQLPDHLTPKAIVDGFLEINNERYATIKRWASYYGVGFNAMAKRLENENSVTGRTTDSAKNQTYFAESVVKKVCPEFEQGLENGYSDVLTGGHFVRDGITYGSTHYWAKILGIGQMAITKRCDRSLAISGKMSGGRIVHNTYYPEAHVRKVCAELGFNIPKADETDTISIEGIAHKTLSAWCGILDLHLESVRRKLGGKKGVTGKTITGRLVEDGFFPEAVIREACEENLLPLPIADANGFLMLGGERYGCQKAWCALLNIGTSEFSERLKGREHTKGKITQGNILNFYGEKLVNEACADLLSHEENGK